MKTIRNSHELRLIRPQTQHKEPEHKFLTSLTPLTPCVKKIANLNQTYYLDNSLPIKGYQMGEISMLGRLMGVCKYDKQAASLYFLYTELAPISKIMFPSNTHGDPLNINFALIWIYPDEFVLFSLLCSASLTVHGLSVCPM
jgi:hypothetical protein